MTNIYRVWTMTPDTVEAIPSTHEEETVAKVAEAFPMVIYFFGEEES